MCQASITSFDRERCIISGDPIPLRAQHPCIHTLYIISNFKCHPIQLFRDLTTRHQSERRSVRDTSSGTRINASASINHNIAPR